jgi:diacylglycerol diphosphate phosphatase / phosphatidate phosphatase
LHVLDPKGEVWRTLIVLIPTLGAGLIAGSRIMDARHHPFDVITGSLLGILCAWISYRQYFPPLSEFRAKGRAYPIRSWGKSLSETAPQQAEYQRTPMDEEHAQPKFASGRHTPPENLEEEHTGNVFREQIHASQRQRRQASQATRVVPSSAYSADPIPISESPPPPVPSHQVPASEFQPAGNPFTRDASQRSQRRTRDNIWDSSDDDEEMEGYELEPSYTLSNPNQYEAPGYERFRAQDTGYPPQTRTTQGQAAAGAGEPSGPANTHEVERSSV